MNKTKPGDDSVAKARDDLRDRWGDEFGREQQGSVGFAWGFAFPRFC